MDRYHGSLCAQAGPEGALLHDHDRHAHPPRTTRAHRKRLRDNRRHWILAAAVTTTSTPMWTSRRGWLDGLAVWTTADEGVAALTAANLRAQLLLRVAEAMSVSADHRTGRHCAATNATVAAAAGCSPRSVTTARRVLAAAGWAIEAYRGTGSPRTPSHRRRPSVWHLISRKKPVHNSTVCDLPPSRSDRRLSLERTSSPRARTRAPHPPSGTPRHAPPRRPLRAPRPLAIQRLADQLTGNRYGRTPLCHGLAHGHIGAICDALITTGIDPTHWTAHQLTDALNTHMRTTGYTWPDHIDRPGAFLASRLRALPDRPPGPTQSSATTPHPDTTTPANSQAHQAQPSTQDTTTTAHTDTQRWYDQVTAATTPHQRRRLLQAHHTTFGPTTNPTAALAGAGRRATRLFPHLPLTQALTHWTDNALAGQPKTPAPHHHPATSLSTELLIDQAIGTNQCLVCTTPNAPQRPQLPLASPICHHCWPHIATQLHHPTQETNTA